MGATDAPCVTGTFTRNLAHPDHDQISSMETFRTESTALNVTLGSTVSHLGKRVQHLRRQLR
jgi:hypothetical protein